METKLTESVSVSMSLNNISENPNINIVVKPGDTYGTKMMKRITRSAMSSGSSGTFNTMTKRTSSESGSPSLATMFKPKNVMDTLSQSKLASDTAKPNSGLELFSSSITKSSILGENNVDELSSSYISKGISDSASLSGSIQKTIPSIISVGAASPLISKDIISKLPVVPVMKGWLTVEDGDVKGEESRFVKLEKYRLEGFSDTEVFMIDVRI